VPGFYAFIINLMSNTFLFKPMRATTMKKSQLASCFESAEVIDIGAPQTLITLTDALGAIKEGDAATVIVETPAAELITVKDAVSAIADADAATPGIVPPEGSDIPDDLEEADPVVEATELEDPALDGEIVVDEDLELPADETVEDEIIEEPIEEDPELALDEGDLELPVEDEDPDFDDLGDAEETEETVDEDQDDLDALNEVKNSLESIALTTRAAVRNGGLTQAEAKVNEEAITSLLERAQIVASKYVISHESFAKDPIFITMEADRSILESIKEIIAKIIAALRGALEGATNHVKALMVVSAKLKKHSLDIQAKLSTLNYTEEVKAKKLDVSQFAKNLGVTGKPVLDPEEALRLIVQGGVKMSAFTTDTKALATKIMAEIDGYVHNAYVAMFDPIVGNIVDQNSPLLPGGKGISKSDTAMIKIVQKDAEISGTFEISIPAPAALGVICDSIKDISTFVDTYGKLVLDTETSIKQLVDQMDTASKRTSESSDDAGKATTAAMTAFVKDSKAIIDHVRGCSGSYIRFAEVAAESALKYVNLCLKQY
jgi:hypothetical protein